jgi:hypothetical protein
MGFLNDNCILNVMYTMAQRCEVGPLECRLNEQMAKMHMNVLFAKMRNKWEVIIYYLHRAS